MKKMREKETGRNRKKGERDIKKKEEGRKKQKERKRREKGRERSFRFKNLVDMLFLLFVFGRIFFNYTRFLITKHGSD